MVPRIWTGLYFPRPEQVLPRDSTNSKRLLIMASGLPLLQYSKFNTLPIDLDILESWYQYLFDRPSIVISGDLHVEMSGTLKRVSDSKKIPMFVIGPSRGANTITDTNPFFTSSGYQLDVENYNDRSVNGAIGNIKDLKVKIIGKYNPPWTSNLYNIYYFTRYVSQMLMVDRSVAIQTLIETATFFRENYF